MITDEDHGVKGFIEAFDHAMTLEAVADQAGAGIEVFRQEVALAAMRIVDDDFGRAAGKRAANRGVGVFSHQLA